MKKILVWSLVLLFVAACGEFAAASDEWPRDLGGRTIRINTRWDDVTPLGPRGDFNWYDPDPRLQSHIESIEEMFNVSIEFVEPVIHGGRIEDFTERFIAGDVDFDYTNVRRDLLPELVAHNMIHPLNDYIDDQYYQNLPANFRPSPGISDLFGKTYMFQSMGYSLESVGVWWNKTIFEDEGLPSLYDIFEAGDWTYDTMEELAVQLTKDTTGDGEIDRYALRRVYWRGIFLPTNYANFTDYRDGRVVATLHEEEAITHWEHMNTLQNELKAVGGNFSIEATAAMEPGRVHNIAYGRLQELVQSDYEIGMVPPPRGPHAEEHRVPSTNIWMGVIPVTEEDPRAVMEVVHALFQNKAPYVDIGQWEEDYWNEWALQVDDRETLDYWRWMQPRVEYPDLGHQVPGLDDALNEMRAGRSPMTVMSEIAPQFQAFLDEMFDQ